MARVWLSVAVLVQIVYANDIMNCDECIRQGYSWCETLGSEHCTEQANDDWCPLNRTDIPPMPSKDGKVQHEKRLYIDRPVRLEIPYDSPTKLQVDLSILDSSQNKNIELSVNTNQCSGPQCIVTIEAIPGADFCSSSGDLYEYAYVKATIGKKQEVTIKYHIACSCMCSKYVRSFAVECNNHGNYSCGVCTCNSGWNGVYCEKRNQTVSGPSVPSKGKNPTKGGPTHVDIVGQTNITIPVGPCSVQINSRKCNYRGDYICGGRCQCRSGWSGKTCEIQICPEKRGDNMHCTNPLKDNVPCSGNGFCGKCDTCVCYNDREGFQYFQEDNYCADLCMVTSDCNACIMNKTLEECPDCMIMAKLPYNESLTNLKDNNDLRIWVKCNEVENNCSIEYWAMRDDNGGIEVMLQSTCNDVEAAYISAGPKVPIIMGILGIIAAVAAIAGVLAWKHWNTVPPLPHSDLDYKNIDAEDCTGENPLYKSPMSSFKNPTYGKW